MEYRDMAENTIENKIERVESIRDELQQAETMNPADAQALHEEAMELLDDLEEDLALADGTIERRE